MLDFEPRSRRALETEDLMFADHLRVANVIPSLPFQQQRHQRQSLPNQVFKCFMAKTQSSCSWTVSGMVSSKRTNGVSLLLDFFFYSPMIKPWNEWTFRRSYQGQLLKLFTTPIPVITFFSALLAKQHIVNLKKCRADNQSTGPTFEEARRLCQRSC